MTTVILIVVAGAAIAVFGYLIWLSFFDNGIMYNDEFDYDPEEDDDYV